MEIGQMTEMIFGLGFDVSDAERDAVFGFLKNHRDAIPEYAREDVLEIVNDENGTLEDLWEVADDETISSLVADIMTKETGISFETFGIGDKGEDVVMFVPKFPWQFNDKEKNSTKEEIVNLMRKYADELGVYFVAPMRVVYSG